MSDAPRGLRPTPEQRNRTNQQAIAPNLERGLLKPLRRVPDEGVRDSRQDGIAVVIHGSDDTATRPPAMVVYWVGSATPSNAEDYDFWYTEDID